MTTAPTNPQPPPAAPPPAPVMARRTYMFLRLAMVAVIAALAVSLTKEIVSSNGCFQGSISAYYYTAVEGAFVGALVALGVGMIALWGKTPVEDAFLNLAGMLAPVVAFVPTSRTNLCGLTTASGVDLTAKSQTNPKAAQAAKASLIENEHGAVFNNMLTLVIIVGVVLAVLLVLGIVAGRVDRPTFIADEPRAYWFPWATALVLWGLGTYALWREREWFYANAHLWSAIVLFVFIIAVVLANGFDKWGGSSTDKAWAVTYWVIGSGMALGVLVILAAAQWIWTGDFKAHRVFAIEAWLIGLLAAFWCLQTWDRRHEPAPRTKKELAALGAGPPEQRPQAPAVPD